VAFNDFIKGYLAPIWESIGHTEGAGYMYGGMQPGAWNDGAFGTITVPKKNPHRNYIHVLTRPSGDTLTVRDNGYKVTRVTDVRTGHRFAFAQRDGRVTISGITSWDTYDTVLRADLAGREGLYRHVGATATASADGHPAATLTDGSYLNWWDSGATLPVSITLDLRRPGPVRFLAINQRENSPTHNRETFGRKEDSARIKDYKVYVSDDGVDWGDPVKAGVLESAKAVRFIDLNPARARYVKLEIDSTWAAATVPNFYQKLAIDEIHVGWNSPTGHGRAR
jgi:alpha-L-fucosidase